LLGVIIFAEGPKATSDASGHDDAVVVHGLLNCLMLNGLIVEERFAFFAQIGLQVSQSNLT
jgi:hypothetical protein